MMLYTPSMLYEMGKQRERELLEAVERERLIRLAASGQPSQLSELVSRLRCWLQTVFQRPEPAPVQEPIPCSG